MIAALVATLLPLAPPGEEQKAFDALIVLLEAAAPEPEPPPGLRAPADTDRHRRAAERYEHALAAWRADEKKRRGRLIEQATAFLALYPESPRLYQARYVRGVTHFQAGDFAAARPDLAAFLKAAPRADAAAPAARRALVASCRALGDFAAALRHGGETPDRLEEAGRIDHAIRAALVAGEQAKAARWRLIGKPFSGRARIPDGATVAVVEAGRKLPDERRTSLRREFASRKVAFLEGFSPVPGVYILSKKRIVLAVDPAPDTIPHRLRSALNPP